MRNDKARHRRWRRGITLVGILFFAWGVVGAAGYFAATSPNPRAITPLRQLAGYALEDHAVQAADASRRAPLSGCK